MNETIKTSNLQRKTISALCFGIVLSLVPTALKGEELKTKLGQEMQRKYVMNQQEHDELLKKIAELQKESIDEISEKRTKRHDEIITDLLYSTNNLGMNAKSLEDINMYLADFGEYLFVTRIKTKHNDSPQVVFGTIIEKKEKSLTIEDKLVSYTHIILRSPKTNAAALLPVCYDAEQRVIVHDLSGYMAIGDGAWSLLDTPDILLKEKGSFDELFYKEFIKPDFLELYERTSKLARGKDEFINIVANQFIEDNIWEAVYHFIIDESERGTGDKTKDLCAIGFRLHHGTLGPAAFMPLFYFYAFEKDDGIATREVAIDALNMVSSYLRTEQNLRNRFQNIISINKDYKDVHPDIPENLIDLSKLKPSEIREIGRAMYSLKK
ncbi:hypothetical protein HYU07_00640 [Candidatus Woesearchaeota archaeon]|nr:hypothetical protein [Candidatus Woesearchaeota archaeon]